MVRKSLLICILVQVLLVGCASSPAFEEASENTPHALLRFEKNPSVSPLAQTVAPIEINGRSPSSMKWTFFEFRIPPGETVVFARAYVSSSVNAHAMLKFQAEDGETYEISRVIQVDKVEFRIRNSKNDLITSAISDKQAINRTPSYVPVFIPAN